MPRERRPLAQRHHTTRVVDRAPAHRWPPPCPRSHHSRETRRSITDGIVGRNIIRTCSPAPSPKRPRRSEDVQDTPKGGKPGARGSPSSFRAGRSTRRPPCPSRPIVHRVPAPPHRGRHEEFERELDRTRSGPTLAPARPPPPRPDALGAGQDVQSTQRGTRKLRGPTPKPVRLPCDPGRGPYGPRHPEGHEPHS